jgi:hypothetical protein
MFFSSAYTISPDGVHQPPAIISQEVEEDEFPEVQCFKHTNISNSNEPLPKWVRFDDSTTFSASLSNNNDDQGFQIGSEVIYTIKGTAQNIVYEGVDSNGVNHYIQHKDGSWSFVSRSTLTLLDQISISNIPKTHPSIPKPKALILFTLVVWRLSIIHPQDTSPSNFMSSLMMTLQQYHTWRPEIPSNWEDLVTHSSEKSTPQALALT